MNDARLRRRLRDVEDPALGKDIVSLGLVRDVTVDGDVAQIELAFNAPHSPDEMAMGRQVREIVEDAGLTPEIAVPLERDADVLPGVRNIIAVTSGKGGVGKSTVAANIAAGLSELGAQVGLLDGDVYGPNAPQIYGVDEEPEMTADNRPIPPTVEGVDVMSSGLVIPDDKAAALRGAMLNKAFQELLEEVQWGQQDYLVVDLPPGTGDVKLTLLQTVPVAGVVGVTTPQGMATDDAIKGLRMFIDHDAPVLGIVENMASFKCPSCDDVHDVFGEGGGQRLADTFEAPLLGKIPLDPSLSEEDGALAVRSGGPASEAFLDLAKEVANGVGTNYRQRNADQGVLMMDTSGPDEGWLN